MAGSVYEQTVLSATRRSSVATLAAALITASGREHSVKEAVALFFEVEQALYPAAAVSDAGTRRPAA
jgi:hypothetical protein